MSNEEDLIAAADALYDSVHTRVFRDEFRAIYLGFHRAPAVTIYDGWLRAVKAEAWNEGYGPDEECRIPRSNPYRKERGDKP